MIYLASFEDRFLNTVWGSSTPETGSVAGNSADDSLPARALKFSFSGGRELVLSKDRYQLTLLNLSVKLVVTSRTHKPGRYCNPSLPPKRKRESSSGPRIYAYTATRPNKVRNPSAPSFQNITLAPASPLASSGFDGSEEFPSFFDLDEYLRFFGSGAFLICFGLSADFTDSIATFAA